MARDLDLLHPKLLLRYAEFATRMAKARLPFMVTCTGRTLNEQAALYAQGRQPLETVNGLRKKAGLYLLGSEAENRVVTWTMKSKHLLRPEDLQYANPTLAGFSRAFDIAMLTSGGRPHWNLKIDVNEDEAADYIQAAEIGKKCGLTAGAFWSKPDYPHFELPPTGG